MDKSQYLRDLIEAEIHAEQEYMRCGEVIKEAQQKLNVARQEWNAAITARAGRKYLSRENTQCPIRRGR